jgi:luciferase-type oxidoreductase
MSNHLHQIGESWRRKAAGSALDKLRHEGLLPTLGVLSPLVNDWGVARGLCNFSPEEHENNIILAEEAGIAAIWLRDIPTYDPDFGDLGQVHDVWTFAGRLTAVTSNILIGTAAVVARLDHPLHILRRAGSIDSMSNGRFVLGIGGGDRANEASLFGVTTNASEMLSKLIEFVPKVWRDLSDTRLFPPPSQPDGVPLLAVGSMGKTISWIKENLNGIFVPSGPDLEARIAQVRAYWPEGVILCVQRIIVEADADLPLTDSGGGTLRGGVNDFASKLRSLKRAGVDHVCLNLRLNSRPISDILEQLSPLAQS